LIRLPLSFSLINRIVIGRNSLLNDVLSVTSVSALEKTLATICAVYLLILN